MEIEQGSLGRREDDAAAMADAITAYRELGAERPDLLSDLAMRLELAARLGELGPREEALSAVEEVVTAYRRLAAERPDAFLPDLAQSLNNLAKRLWELGRREEALAAVEEAVTCYRELAAARPDAFLPGLAGSLHHLAGDLWELFGRPEEALAAIEEAVTIRRELAAERPDAFLPDLATSLNDLSKWLGALGRREEGLAAIEEAVTIRRELAVARPDAFLADLARSLYNLAIDLGELGRREEGLAAAEEAVAAYRRLAALRPDAFLPDLAASLNDLAIDLGALGRDEEGLAAVEEADALRATAELHLTLDRPENAEAAASALDQYASDSLDRARPLTALAESTGLQGRLVDAVGLALDAVRLYDHHAPLPPHRDIELAQTLCIVADLHSALGEHRKAEECAGRAAGIVYRQWLVDASARYSLFMQVLHKLVAYAVDAADLAAAVEGAKLRVTAVRGHADAPLEELAGFLGELGSLQARHGAHVDAMATFTEAGELVSGCPYDRAVLDARRSSALHNLGRTTEAVQLSKYAIDLLSPVEKEPSHPLLPWLGHLHHDLSTYLKAEQRPREALREAEHAVSVYERVAADNPAEHREQLVSALTLAGALLDELGETEQARRMRMRLQDLPQDIGDSRIEAPVKDIRHIAAMLRRPR